eukprot:scaffold16441_cov79-Phaeocystis_antarctica.AAC.4
MTVPLMGCVSSNVNPSDHVMLEVNPAELTATTRQRYTTLGAREARVIFVAATKVSFVRSLHAMTS